MRQILFLFVLLFFSAGISAQPKARRQAQQQAAQKSNANNITNRAKIMFPTSSTMDEDVVWRRDIYRELDLTQSANAGLYYPVEPTDGEMNLFTCIFKLMMRGSVKAYEYRLDGNEVFTDSARIKPLAFLDNYHIYYEKVNGKVKLDNSDIPSREVKSYYIKESAYFDQNTATFHKKVLALCPIMTREDDFGDGEAKYPLFWVKYDDLAPYLTKQQVMASDLNNASVMSLDDYFTRNLYQGKIYKTNNMLGRTLAQYCPTDSAMNKEQQKIEAELAAFEKNLWGDPARKDSLDSIAKLDASQQKTIKKRNRRTAVSTDSGSKTSKSQTVKNRRAKVSASNTSAARVTVRRERH